MNDITEEHKKQFYLPVDSQVIRVALNTGILKIIYLENTEYKYKQRKIENVGTGLIIKREEMTDVVKLVWQKVANKLEVPMIELDDVIYNIGSLYCNRFGKSCYLCPITEVCESWARKLVNEGMGVDWNKSGIFSYGKGVFDQLFFKTCPTCDPFHTCTHKHPVQIYLEEKETISFSELRGSLSL